MGDAYAKATGELTLVSVHSGPGLTNAITGIAEAAKSRTPLLVLAGDVPTGNVKSNFYFDQAELVRSVGAVSERTYTPQSARSDLLRAVTRVMRDRQTVVLSLPLDVQDAKLNGTNAPLELTPMPGRLAAGPEGRASARGGRIAGKTSAHFGRARRRVVRRRRELWSLWRIAWVRCWRRRFVATAFSRTIHGRSVSAVAFHRRSQTS